VAIDIVCTTRHIPITVSQKSHRSEPSAKNESGEYATFKDALKKVLSVPCSEMEAALNADKKRRASSRVSRAKH
jgi:hypothetical protein